MSKYEEPSIRDLARIPQMDWTHHEATAVRMLPELIAALDDAEEALDNYQDVKDGPEGRQVPNAAMRAYEAVVEVLRKVRS